MRANMEAGCGMSEILMVGCGVKILPRERDLLILTGGTLGSFKIDGEMRDEKQKITCTCTLFTSLKMSFVCI